MDHLTPLQDNVLKSLLDFVVAVGWVCWERLTACRKARRARAEGQNLPVLRLETWRVMLAKTSRSLRVKPRRVRWVNKGVVAVLVPQSQMVERVRRALGALYARLTTRNAALLLRLGQAGIHNVIFYQYDDAPPRFAAAFDWGGGRNGPPLQAA